MLIKKGTRVKINHSHKGIFEGIADSDFSTEDEWYPIKLTQAVEDLGIIWEPGESITCRRFRCTIKVIEKGAKNERNRRSN